MTEKTLTEQVRQRMLETRSEFSDDIDDVMHCFSILKPILAAHEQREAELIQGIQKQRQAVWVVATESLADKTENAILVLREQLSEQAQEIERLRGIERRIAHCENCGGTVYQSGDDENPCPCKLNEEIERLKADMLAYRVSCNRKAAEAVVAHAHCDGDKRELADLRAKVEEFRLVGEGLARAVRRYHSDERSRGSACSQYSHSEPCCGSWASVLEFSRLFPERRSHDEPTR